MKLTSLSLLFLFFSGVFLIISNYNLNLLDNEDRSSFVDRSLDWAIQLSYNAGKITSYVISLDWIPGKSEKETDDSKKKNESD